MTRAVVALGANLGDRDSTLRQAVAELALLPGTTVVAASKPIESVAVTLEGLDESKPSYVNGVALLETSLDPDALLAELNRIEDEHGRVRVERWGDRTLDLDLIVHGETIATGDRLTLPHPRAAERSFVLEPWLEVDPGASIPGSGDGTGPVAALAARLADPVHPVVGASRLDVQAELADGRGPRP